MNQARLLAVMRRKSIFLKYFLTIVPSKVVSTCLFHDVIDRVIVCAMIRCYLP